MPILPDDANPFRRESVYRQLEIPTYASSSEVSARLKELQEEIEQLPVTAREKKKRILQQGLKSLRSLRMRVLLNALEHDHIYPELLLELLQRSVDQASSEQGLPELGLEQLIVEGDSLAFARSDFAQVERDEQLGIEVAELGRIFARRTCEPHYLFEL